MNIGNQKTTHKFTYSTLTRMKWKAIEPHQGDFITEDADNMIAWAHSNNITVRGYLVIHNISFSFQSRKRLYNHNCLFVCPSVINQNPSTA